VNPPNTTTAPTLHVRANLTARPWEQANAENTSGGYVVGVALDRDAEGREVAVVLVQVAADHYVVAWTTYTLADRAVRFLAASPIAAQAML